MKPDKWLQSKGPFRVHSTSEGFLVVYLEDGHEYLFDATQYLRGKEPYRLYQQESVARNACRSLNRKAKHPRWEPPREKRLLEE